MPAMEKNNVQTNRVSKDSELYAQYPHPNINVPTNNSALLFLWSGLKVSILLRATWTALCSPGFIRGACRRKLVNFILKTIYGGTGINASLSFENDPRVAQRRCCTHFRKTGIFLHNYLGYFLSCFINLVKSVFSID